jgi:hypothetical protein
MDPRTDVFAARFAQTLDKAKAREPTFIPSVRN